MTSIIIGCYNVASWLREKRLMDIRQQSDANIEIILVDDGSTDNTPVLLQTLAEEDSRIRVITKENGGLGSARNAGLDAAQGEYVWFYDVDDEASSDLVEKNVKWMNSMNTDLNIFGFTATTVSIVFSEDVLFTEELIEDNATLHDNFLDKLFFVRYGNGFAWNKFYRREFLELHNIRFGDQRIQQDELFNFQIYPLAQRVYLSSEVLYHYFIYEHGNTRSRYIPNRYAIYQSIYNGITNLALQWQITDNKLQDYAIRRLYDGMSQSILFNIFHPDSPLNRNEQNKEIKRILQHPLSQKSIHYMERHPPQHIEQCLYLMAFRRQSVLGIRILRQCFSLMRRMRNVLRALS